jgi:repressor LexA
VIYMNRIKELRELKKLSQNVLAEKLNTKQSTISGYETGTREPDNDTLKRLAIFFDVSIDYLLGVSETNYPWDSERYIEESQKRKEVESKLLLEKLLNSFKVSNITTIPILGVIRAGEPIRAEQNIISYEYLPEDMTQGGEYFGLRVVGDSMNNARILADDVVIVREQPEIENGEIAVVLVNGEDATIKRFYQTDTMVTLMPDSSNKEYQPRFIDITKTEIKILGKVVRFIGKP